MSTTTRKQAIRGNAASTESRPPRLREESEESDASTSGRQHDSGTRTITTGFMPFPLALSECAPARERARARASATSIVWTEGTAVCSSWTGGLKLEFAAPVPSTGSAIDQDGRRAKLSRPGGERRGPLPFRPGCRQLQVFQRALYVPTRVLDPWAARIIDKLDAEHHPSF